MTDLKGNLLVQTFQAAGWVYPKDHAHTHKASVYRAYEAKLNTPSGLSTWSLVMRTRS